MSYFLELSLPLNSSLKHMLYHNSLNEHLIYLVEKFSRSYDKGVMQPHYMF
jgi:hypothetical protein